MTSIAWRWHRLRAMDIPEIIWRLSQKRIRLQEQKQYGTKKFPVTKIDYSKKIRTLKLDASKMHLNVQNRDYFLGIRLPLIGGYDYAAFRKHWNAGFQTANDWPDTFSYKLKYKQRDDIGDARTNWELNRHFQLAILAKNYAASGEEQFLKEFLELFQDWNDRNPFLWGISWTSVMEIAIRCSNWCYACCFLKQCENVPSELISQLETGILNMTAYITRHYSRYSSANNHLIVEAYAIGQSGILFGYQPWIDLSISVLTRELPLQNYSDGVNKEASLHYQLFYMEAMGLMTRLLIKNGLSIPAGWEGRLDKMCRYVSDCTGDHGEIVLFGDDDEGKILDLHGGLNYHEYVLALFSFLFSFRYINLDNIQCENINWLFTREELGIASTKERYESPLCSYFPEGGNTILRSNDRRILIGIDHGALGFGSIAAHGHADALSFQIFAEGIPLLVDPGTSLYHCDLNSRNGCRKTDNHNTACVEGKDQSEMLGAFLWGKKAECCLIGFEERTDKVILKASHNGYRPNVHTREFIFDRENELQITDSFTVTGDKSINFIFAPGADISLEEGNKAAFRVKGIHGTLQFACDDAIKPAKRKTAYYRRYGVQEQASVLSVHLSARQIKTRIKIAIPYREA